MHRFDLRCAPSLLCLVLATGSLAAQGTQKPDESPVPATQAAFPTVSIQFRGGTLRDYLEALRATGDHNIVIPERAERVVVPPLTLKAVSLANAIEIVAKTTDRERFSVAMTRLEGRGNPVYAVQVEDRQRNPAPARDGNAPLTVTRVFALHNITQAPYGMQGVPGVAVEAEAVLSAIRIGIDVAAKPGDMPVPTLKFHEESGLLFVQGHPMAAELVSAILRELETSLALHRNQVPRSDPKPNEAKIDSKPARAR